MVSAIYIKKKITRINGCFTEKASEKVIYEQRPECSESGANFEVIYLLKLRKKIVCNHCMALCTFGIE